MSVSEERSSILARPRPIERVAIERRIVRDDPIQLAGTDCAQQGGAFDQVVARHREQERIAHAVLRHQAVDVCRRDELLMEVERGVLVGAVDHHAGPPLFAQVAGVTLVAVAGSELDVEPVGHADVLQQPPSRDAQL
jgi:hypothetical protein